MAPAGVTATKLLIGYRDDAPNAELGCFKRRSIQDDAVSSIFAVGLASLHHDVWAEAVHVNRLCESSVEIIERRPPPRLFDDGIFKKLSIPRPVWDLACCIDEWVELVEAVKIDV